jgi:aryl-alcohol dehydrogenase-like predicted oxidoreductase
MNQTTIAENTIQLGNSGLMVPPLGIGTWQWGDTFFWGYGRGTFTDDDIRQAFEAALQAGVSFFDTAEAYGRGRSETILGNLIRQSGQPVLVATKFMPLPLRLRRANLLSALQASLKRLQMTTVDLYQIHWPSLPVSIETWMQAMAEAAGKGWLRAVGVSNYNALQMSRAHAELQRAGLPLASNQVEYSLLERSIERNGVLSLAQELGVTIIAYSPLRKGILTGKYSPANPPPGVRSRMYGPAYLARVQPLIDALGRIGQAHGGRTPGQVALNWTICKGTLPIPGPKNLRQAQDNLGALGWRLTPEEIAELDGLSDRVAG